MSEWDQTRLIFSFSFSFLFLIIGLASTALKRFRPAPRAVRFRSRERKAEAEGEAEYESLSRVRGVLQPPPPIATFVTMNRSFYMALALAATLLWTPPAPALAQQPTPGPAASDGLRAYLITLGPGAAVWERFGHNALWIHDPFAGTDIAYHYGLFDMTDEGFMLHFLQGRMWYSMGSEPADWMIRAYRQMGRDAFVQELRLTDGQVRELQAFLEWNMLPENRVYRYDYFRDNCSTRIRDALDRVTDGAIHDALADRPSPLTYREQAVALTAEDVLLTTGMDLGLGPLADQPISRWDLAFIPMRLHDDLATVTLDHTGTPTSIVGETWELPATGERGDLAAVAPNETSTEGRALWHLLVGLLVGGLLAGAGWITRHSEPTKPGATVARWTLTIVGSAWALAAGVLGVILLALWTLTDHEFAWRNENLLQTTPLALALVVLIPLAVIGGRRPRAAWIAAATLAALSLLGLLIHPLPLTLQGNLPIIALALPIHVGLALGLSLSLSLGLWPAATTPAGRS